MSTIQPVRQVIMLEQEWGNFFMPVKNHLDSNASWEGCMFETYGAELAHVQAMANGTADKQRCVWTIVEPEEALIVVSGLHFVNRIGYLITDQPAPEGVEFEIYSELSEVPRALRKQLVKTWEQQ